MQNKDSSLNRVPDSTENNYLSQNQLSKNFQQSGGTTYVMPTSSVNNSSRVGEIAFYGEPGSDPRPSDAPNIDGTLNVNGQNYYKKTKRQRSKDNSHEKPKKRKRKKSKKRKSPLGRDPNRYLSQSPSEYVPVKEKVRSARKAKQM